jgi:hypothetical protein
VVCLDPLAWLRAGLITNPGMFLLGQPGTGKSALAKRLAPRHARPQPREDGLGLPRNRPRLPSVRPSVIALTSEDDHR